MAVEAGVFDELFKGPHPELGGTFYDPARLPKALVFQSHLTPQLSDIGAPQKNCFATLTIRAAFAGHLLRSCA